MDEAGQASSRNTNQPDPFTWKEPRLYHQPFDDEFADRIVIAKSSFPAALLTPVHSPNKAYYYMTVKPDFSREGPWSTEIYIYAEKDQMTRVDLRDHSAYAPDISWINEKLLSIRVWWGRLKGTDLIIDVEMDRIVSMEMVVDGQILSKQQAASSKAMEGRGTTPDHAPPITELRRKLQSGTPEEKEAALDGFTENFPVALVPDVIAAILDDTKLPRREDTGWGTVHHHAATAMCYYAQRIDGLTQKERGRHEYSFYDDGGVATTERRREVYINWLAWWGDHAMDTE